MYRGENENYMTELRAISNNGERRRQFIAQRNATNFDWIATLQQRVTDGTMKQEDMFQKIARAMTARELVTARTHEKMEKKAEENKYDPLTGLLLKRHFHEALASAIANNENFGLLILDLDHFSQTNEKFGHLGGDGVLSQVGLILRNELRQSAEIESDNDVIGRVGGEEIAVLLRNIPDDETLFRVGEKLRTAIFGNMSVTVAGKQHIIPVSMSVGGARHVPGNTPDIFDMVDKQGMYEAKKRGRNQTVIIPAPALAA